MIYKIFTLYDKKGSYIKIFAFKDKNYTKEKKIFKSFSLYNITQDDDGVVPKMRLQDVYVYVQSKKCCKFTDTSTIQFAEI